ncbi:hypothetical protein PspLS_05121 [Pyricularia sp. CBS 133598]|nr:hypothetical protein PspLS_05121 [Pyricularia sp. CBS 133598]
MATTPQQQAAERIIRHNKTQYLHWVDTNQADKLPSLFLPSATFIFLERDGSTTNKFGLEWDFRDGAAYLAFMKGSIGAQPHQLIHMVDRGLFEHVSDDEVRVVWTLFYKVGPADDTTGKGHRDCGAHCHETWKRVPGKDDWMLASMKVKNLYERNIE